MKLFNKRIFQGFSQLMLLAMVGLPGSVLAEPPLDIATTPLANSGPSVIKPNMLYVLDDSGSMDRDYMPDWATDGNYQDDASYNAVAYDPAVRYDPPANYTAAGAPDTTTYPSQSGVSGNTGANWQTKPNWRSVSSNAYRNGGNTNLENLNGGTGPRYTVSIANEFCTRTDLRVCVASPVPTQTHPYPARIRWCNNAAVATGAALPANNACQSVRIGTFTNLRVPVVVGAPGAGPSQATITFTNASSTPRITGITVNGQQIMRRRTGQNWTNNTSNIAERVRGRINDCTNGAWENCTVSGYSATRNGNVLTIFAPGTTTVTPAVTFNSGNITATPTQFSSPAVVTNNRQTVSITPGNNSYIYPGTIAKHASRTDCASTTCTYNEEMENYANWYTYYRTRMQMMKTSTSLAFKDVGDDFRMGFMTINSNAALNFKDFSGSDKATWYSTLFGVAPNGGTPLPRALSNAGRVYANKHTQGGIFTDPIQYACQPNFTLLTTDGVYNGPDSFRAGIDLAGAAIGDEDSASSVLAPKRDGRAQAGTLADVAKYYRDTDLRTTAEGNCTGATGNNVCETSGTLLDRDQTMVTFTLGLGVDGALAYSTTYEEDTSGDFADIKSGAKNWSDVVPGDKNWNFPDNVAAGRTDDVWHAAVNGDGKYFSAKKTRDLIEQLREAISLIKVRTGSGAAAATSTLNPVSGDNYAYVASYTSGKWTGNLEKREIDVNTGEVNRAALACVEDVVPEDNCASPSVVTPDGSGGYSCVTTGITDATSCAGTLVGTECRITILPTCFSALKDQVTNASRTIYFKKGSGLTSPFVFADLTIAQQANFSSTFLQSQLTQASAYTPDQLTNLTGHNLFEYIKGDKTYEQTAGLEANKLFRTRTAILGDLIDSKPSFIGKPTFNYGDSGYQDFKASYLARVGTVYVGSNDGMLHAFDSESLEERWAFVPSAVIPNLWRLADSNYSAKHNYFVNGDVTISDICVAADCTIATGADWKTILVGGLDGGGRGYYALDITNPTSPILLWEIDPSDPGFENLGYTYGNPVVTKRAGDDKWVVAFTSGYNNIPDNNAFYSSSESTNFKPNLTPQFNTGDGKGYLYVVDANTGNRLATIATGVGSQASPSGLSKIAAYADFAETNNTATYVYGGDLDGNVWRFNIESTVNSALHFATLKDASNVAQPIMTPVELGEVKNKRVVIVGTGKYLETTDLDAAGFTVQSLYALRDTANDGDAGPIYANPRSVTGIVNQTVVPDSGQPNRRVSGTSNAVDFATDFGWYLDFPDSGERQNVASQLVLGTLLVPTTVPTASACQPAGYGWFNFFDYRTGLAVPNGSGAVSQRTTAPSVGFNVVFIDGVPKVSNVQADNPNPDLIDDVPFDKPAEGFQGQRSIWREIVDVD